MATSFDVPQNKFLNKISDRNLITITSTELELFLDEMLISSLTWFRKCKTSLSYNGVTREFEEDLDDDEIEILSLTMVQQYLKPQKENVDLIKQKLSTRDYKIYSQANHIDSLEMLYNNSRTEYKQLIREYVDIRTDLDDLYNES